MKRLIEIQQKLIAPKNQYNSFGEYSYRSCEDILNAVKPLLKEYELALLLTDDIVLIGERYYVKATARLVDNSGKEIASTSAFARETFEKKKSDDSQLTGAASSYARKYALNGLFCIDDVKDTDDMDKRKNKPKSTGKSNNDISKTEFITLAQKEELRNKIGGKSYSEEMNACGGKMSVKKYEELMAQKGVNNG